MLAVQGVARPFWTILDFLSEEMVNSAAAFRAEVNSMLLFTYGFNLCEDFKLFFKIRAETLYWQKFRFKLLNIWIYMYYIIMCVPVFFKVQHPWSPFLTCNWFLGMHLTAYDGIEESHAHIHVHLLASAFVKAIRKFLINCRTWELQGLVLQNRPLFLFLLGWLREWVKV